MYSETKWGWTIVCQNWQFRRLVREQNRELDSEESIHDLYFKNFFWRNICICEINIYYYKNWNYNCKDRSVIYWCVKTMFLNLFIVCSLFREKNPNKIRSIISLLKLSFSQNTSLLKCDYQMYIILQFSNKMYQDIELDGYVIWI